MSNFLEHYAQSWGRSVAWAERRLDFFALLAELLSRPGTEAMLREWCEDREKMQQRMARKAEIGSGEFTYYQGAAQEVGMLVDNWRAELAGFRVAQAAFNEEDSE